MKIKLWLFALALLSTLFVFTACSSDSDENNEEQVYTFTVDTGGGVLEVPDGGPTLTIQEGSLNQEVEITVTKIKNVGNISAGEDSDPFTDKQGGLLNYFDAEGNEVDVDEVDVKEVSDVFEFGPEGLVFEKPVSITIPYFTDRVETGSDLHFFWTKQGNRSVFEEIDQATFDGGNATAEVDHFSEGKIIVTLPKADGDVEQDQEEQPQEWPSELTISPASDSDEASLAAPVIILSTVALDPNALNFEFTDGTASVDGWSKFGKDDKAFYFFPTNLLEPGQTFTVTLDFDGTEYNSSFTTVSDAGQNLFVGNAAAGTDQSVSFHFEMSNVYEPGEYEESILGMKSVVKYLLAPVFVDEATDSLVYGAGDAKSFQGEENPMSLNYGALGVHLEAQINGSYFLFSNPVSILYRDATVEANEAFLGGKIVEGQGGKPEIVDGFIGIFMEDCSELTVAFPNVAFAVVLSQICDTDTGKMLMACDFGGSFNELPDTAFQVETSKDFIEFTASSPLWTDWNGINKYHANLTIVQGTTTVFDSDDATATISYPDLAKLNGSDYYNFTKIRFDLSTPLNAGDYDLRLIFGLEGVEDSFNISD